MSRVMRKPDYLLCENKGVDQRWGSHAANQSL